MFCADISRFTKCTNSLFIDSGISQLDEITAVERCDVVLPWTYPAQYEKAEWFEGDESCRKLMMTFTPGTDDTAIEPGFNVQRDKKTGSIGLVLSAIWWAFLNRHISRSCTLSIVSVIGTCSCIHGILMKYY